MTDLEKFEAAFAALPPLSEEVRATVLVLWLEVMSGNVDLATLRELCLESLAGPKVHFADAMMLNLVDQLIAFRTGRASLAVVSARPPSGIPRGFRLGARIRSRLRAT